jgi:hypothetical protein
LATVAGFSSSSPSPSLLFSSLPSVPTDIVFIFVVGKSTGGAGDRKLALPQEKIMVVRDGGHALQYDVLSQMSCTLVAQPGRSSAG